MRDAMNNPIIEMVSETKRNLYTFSTEYECWETLWEDGKYTYYITCKPFGCPDPQLELTVKDDGTYYEDRLDDDALQEIILDWIEARA